MNQFYISFIFIGIVLVAFSLVLVLLDKKKVFSFLKNYEEKKQELVEIINDAEQMIEELNKFSDYIVTQMDFKSEELSQNLKKADDRINHLTQRVKELNISYKEPAVEYKNEFEIKLEEQPVISSEIGMAVNSNNFFNNKVIPINLRHNEVLRLHKSGLNENEIAKKLGIGKGEIQLILELNK